MKLGELSTEELFDQLRGSGLCLRTGPFTFRIQGSSRELASSLRFLYSEFVHYPATDLPDFQLRLQPPPKFWQRWRRRVVLVVDGAVSSSIYQRRSAPAALEFGMNTCIWTQAHQYLIIHAAVVERDGKALILCAPSGSGKSTLCAALMQAGWRLLSDELAIVRFTDGLLMGVARPIRLKNESIRLIRNFAPDAQFAPLCPKTPKGLVALLKATDGSVQRVDEPAVPAWVVFPCYGSGSRNTRLQPQSKGASFLRLAQNSMNYGVLGQTGFDAMANLVDCCEFFDLKYSDLDDAVACFEKLIQTNTRQMAETVA